MKLVDTHAHLYSEKFAPDLDEVIARAQEVLEAVFLPNVDQQSIPAMDTLVARAPDFFFPMMGLHPCHVEPDYPQVLDEMESLLESGKYVGVGETGLDLYWDKSPESLHRQQASLERHIHWAKRLGLPIILHARDAIDPTLEMIRTHHDASLHGIFHCFDGDATQAQAITELGNFKLGIGGIITYRKKLQEVLKNVDLTFLVLETDSPYLAPAPHRGQRNESSYTRFVARKLVEIYDLPFQEIANITTQNAREVFSTAQWASA